MKRKKSLLRLAVLVTAMMCALGASAYSFVYNNFYYNITGTNPATVEVTYKDTNYNSYSGNVTIPSSVTYNGVTYTVTAIGAGAFQNCDYLIGVVIPNTVKTIGVAAFNNCYHYDFTTLVLPPSVITIESCAFDNCSGLTQLTLPASLKTIGREAFRHCANLKHVTIPASVTSIGSDAFGYCSSLLGVTCLAATPPTLSGNYTFYSSVYSGGTLFVPKGSVDAYKSANYWSRFTNVQPHLEYALNEKGSNITFSSTGDYPWTNIVEGSRVYARSGNMGAHNSSSTMTATVTLSAPDSIKFDFKAWGEGTTTFYDKCVFSIDGTAQFTYGAFDNDWTTYSAYLSTGTHTLTWHYTKDGSINPTGDYFAVDNVRLVTEGYACYTTSNKTLTFYYDAKRSSRSGTTYDLNTGNDYPGWYSDNTKNNVTMVVFDPSFANARPTTTCAWFRDMTQLQTIYGLYYLNTSQVTSMRGMFAWCDNLKSVDVFNFNTANVTDMIAMFAYCEQLSSLNLSHFSTSNVTLMSNMFVGCHQLTSLDVSSFNTDKVTNMYAMFGDCPKLTSLNLSRFNTDKVTDMSLMFHDCSQLQTIYVGDGWSTAAVANSSNMFKNCTSLVGGKGTTYDASHIDKAYAHIDDGPSNPGYLTEIPPEAYACYTESNTTLTFYCDYLRSSRTGTTYDLNTGSDFPGWRSYQSPITNVVFDLSFTKARPTSTCNWFFGMDNLTTIVGIEYLNTSEVTNMDEMFYYCSGLTSLNLSCFNTAKVTRMERMFKDCTGLTSLNLSSFNTANVTRMEGMFWGCIGLTSLNLSSFNTANVTNMSDMFAVCPNLTSLDLSNFNTSNVTSMGSMFEVCSGLTSLDLSNWNTANVTSMQDMFADCPALTTIYVGDGWSTAAVTRSNDMFKNCTSLVGGMGTTYDANHIDKAYAHIDGGPSNPGYLSAVPPEAYACYTPSNTTLTFYYDNQRSSRPGTTYDLNTSNITPGWVTDASTRPEVTKVVFDPSFANARPTTTFSWFYFMLNLESITGMSYLNTSEVTNMDWMFTSCRKLTSLDLSHFNTSAVTNMSYMFFDCSNLRTIYVSGGWTTAAVTNSENMFYNCTSLVGGKGTTFDASHIDKAYAHIDGGSSNPGYFTEILPEAYACYTPSNTTLTFYYDTQRSSRTGTTYDLNTNYDTPGWITDDTYASVTKVVFDPSFADARPLSTAAWFKNMENLHFIEGVKYLNTSEVYLMPQMYYGCSSITSLDLSSFNTSKVSVMNHMFNRCANLRTIYVGDGWSTSAVNQSSNMFYGCTSLVGGMGTTWNDSNPKDKTYAHIDGGPSNPGYFTAKNAGLRGDVNGDGHVSIADVSALIDALLSGETPPAGADCNQSGNVSIADVSSLIDYLLSGQWP